MSPSSLFAVSRVHTITSCSACSVCGCVPVRLLAAAAAHWHWTLAKIIRGNWDGRCSFGLTREKDVMGTIAATSNVAMTGCGTLYWMAPEVIRGEAYNQSVDVYAYGMCLYEMFACIVPFKGIPAAEIPFKVANGDRPKFRGAAGGAERVELQQLIEHCWQQKREQRPEFGVSLKKDTGPGTVLYRLRELRRALGVKDRDEAIGWAQRLLAEAGGVDVRDRRARDKQRHEQCASSPPLPVAALCLHCLVRLRRSLHLHCLSSCFCFGGLSLTAPTKGASLGPRRSSGCWSTPSATRTMRSRGPARWRSARR